MNRLTPLLGFLSTAPLFYADMIGPGLYLTFSTINFLAIALTANNPKEN